MNLSSILNIAKGALSAAQTSVQVTSNNIANVNTTGYARQEAVLEEASPNGVSVTTITRYYDRYLESSIRGKNSDAEEQSVLSTYLTRIEGFLNEDNSQLSSNLTSYFNAWQNLSTDPQNTGMLQTIVSRGDMLTQSINAMYTDLKDLQAECNDQVLSNVDSINGMLSSIAGLNTHIIESSGMADSSSSKNSYLDQKTALLGKLSKKMDITTFDDKYGRTTVLTTGGKPLVEYECAWTLTAVPDETTGYANVAWKDGGGTVTDITDQIRSGKLKAMIDTRDTYTPEFLSKLYDLSTALIDNVKWTTTIGGVSSTTSFFQGTSAGNIAVSTSLANDPSLLTASSDPDNSPTGNDIALAMASLIDEKLCGNGTLTFTDFASSIASRIGQLTSNANKAAEYSSDALSILTAQRASVSGVSIDDEMANLIKFQYAYQAASRLFTVADELLQSLLAVAR
ncbi:MAG: flagellar hook-associated protein FlgK [Syntrophus sp. (in: bacteria)]|nr:flagellar hook-associated protein FlgK [Syntrophus sp. (in: bacteria)]